MQIKVGHVLQGTMRDVSYVVPMALEVVQTRITTKTLNRRDSNRSWKIGGRSRVDVPTLEVLSTGEAGVSFGSKKASRAVEIREKIRTQSQVRMPGVVEAMSGEDVPMWRVSSVDEESALQGEYLDTEPLCEIETDKGAAHVVAFFCSDRSAIVMKDGNYPVDVPHPMM